MKRGRLLHADLSHAIAMMGHGDYFVVSDAGFPIPLDAWRIDLAIAPNVPDLYTVLDLVLEDLIVERVLYAKDIEDHNVPLLERLRTTFDGTGAELESVPHARMIGEIAKAAKVIVRTGAFNPWGNIALVCGTDPDAWFAMPGTKIPEPYARRRAQIRKR